MTTLIAPDRTAHMEDLASAIILICANGVLNSAISIAEAAGQARDTAYFAAMGVTGRLPVTVESIPNDNMFYGHRPTLMERPKDSNFPALAALAFEQSAGGDTSLDQYYGVEIIADCELLVKAGPIKRDDYTYVAEDVLVRRTHRTVEAFLSVINGNPTLSGRFMPKAQPPVIRLSEVFVGHGDAQKGGASSPRWLFQIARVITRYARLEQAY